MRCNNFILGLISGLSLALLASFVMGWLHSDRMVVQPPAVRIVPASPSHCLELEGQSLDDMPKGAKKYFNGQPYYIVPLNKQPRP